MGTDARFALRRLAATPLFTAFAILSLAAGVAITTAMYSIVDGVFLRGQGIRDPDRLAVVVTPYSGRLMTGVVSEPDFRDLQAAQTSFTHLSASATSVRRLASPSVTQMMIGEAVSGSYFATLGVGAALGRPIQPTDDDAHARVVMLSDTLWRRRFSSDPRVVGTTVSISGERFEVIGVAPSSFSGPRGWLMGTQFWIPLGTESQLKEAPRQTTPPARSERENQRLTVFGRLAPAGTIAAASAELQTIAARLDRSFPSRFPGKGVAATDRPWRARTMAAVGEEDNAVRRFGLLLVALVALVLVVACTNLGNLVLARGTTRMRELAVRRALGASTWRLVREQCLESVILAAGGAVASYIAFQLLSVLMDAEFSLPLPFGGRTTLAFHPVLNAPALTIAVSSLLVALVVFGLEPAIQLTRTLDLRGALAAGSSGGPPPRRRQRILLRWQVAIAAGFFIIATMFVKYSIAEARHDSGIDIDRVAVAVLDFGTPEWNEPRARRMADRVLDELRTHPSIDTVSLAGGLPFGVPSTLRLSLSPMEQAGARQIDPLTMTAIAGAPALFRTLGIEVLRGRGFDDRDGPAAARVVVLSEFTARQIFGTADGVGRQVALGSGDQDVAVAAVRPRNECRHAHRGIGRPARCRDDDDLGAETALARTLRQPAHDPLGQQSCADDADDDQDEHRVHDRRPEEPDLEPDQRDRERGRGLRDREHVHGRTLGSAEPEQRTGQPTCRRFASERGNAHERRQPQGLALDHHGRVEQQPDRDQEDRHEDGRPEELDPLHRRALVGDEPVERDPREERSDDALDPEDLCEQRHEEQRQDHDQVARDAIGAPPA